MRWRSREHEEGLFWREEPAEGEEATSKVTVGAAQVVLRGA